MDTADLNALPAAKAPCLPRVHTTGHVDTRETSWGHVAAGEAGNRQGGLGGPAKAATHAAVYRAYS